MRAVHLICQQEVIEPENPRPHRQWLHLDRDGARLDAGLLKTRDDHLSKITNSDRGVHKNLVVRHAVYAFVRLLDDGEKVTQRP